MRPYESKYKAADIATTLKYGVTGLGLTLYRHFCQMRAAPLTEESIAGQDLTFTKASGKLRRSGQRYKEEISQYSTSCQFFYCISGNLYIYFHLYSLHCLQCQAGQAAV